MKIGMWLWNEKLSDADYDYLVSIGVDRLYIKTADGVTTWFDSFAQIAAARAHGIVEVYSWSYNYGDQPAREAIAVIGSLQHSDGHVLDPEVEWRDQAASELRAVTIMQEIRKSPEGDKPVLVSSFAQLDLHRGFPVSSFSGLVDGWMPQVFQADWPQNSAGAWKGVIEASYLSRDPAPVDILWECHDGQVTGDMMRTLVEEVSEATERLNLWRYGTLSAEAWKVLEACQFSANRGFKMGTAEQDEIAELVERLGYLQGDVAVAIESPLVALRKRVRSRQSLALVDSALAAVGTLKDS